MANQSVWPKTEEEQLKEFMRQGELQTGASTDPTLQDIAAQIEAGRADPSHPYVQELIRKYESPLHDPSTIAPELLRQYHRQQLAEETPPTTTPGVQPPAPEQRPDVGPLAFFSPEQQAPGGMPAMPAMPGTGRLERAIETIRGLPGKYTKEVGEAAEGVAQAGEQLKTARQLYAEKEAYLKDKQAATARTGLQAAVELDTEMRAKRQVAEQRVTTSLQAYEDELQKQMKEKPVEGWGLGKRLGAGIAMALGAIGSAYTGGPNQAMQIIKMGIEREAEEHRRRAALRREQLRAKNVIYQLARESFTDVESQISAAKIQQLNGVRQQLAVQTMESEGPLIRAKSAEMDKLLEYEIEKERAKLTENEVRNELVLGQAVVAGEQTLLGAKMAGAGMRQKALAAKQKTAVEQQKMKVPGLTVIGTPSKEDRKEAVKFTGNYNRANRAIESLIVWRKKHGPGIGLDREAIRQGKALTNRAIIALKKLDEMGANFTPMEKELIGLSEDPGEFGFYLRALNTIRDSINQEAAEFLRPMSYAPTSQMYKKSGQKIGQSP